MTIKELKFQLIKAYEIPNLNRISLRLINLYKSQQYSILRKIAEIIGDFVCIEIQDDGKGFNKFMMLYHPDRAGFHLKEIDKLVKDDNFDGLLEYSHILKLERIDEIADSLDSFEDIDYLPVYEWDFDEPGFSTFTDNEKSKKEKKKKNKNCNFYDAIKIREYGHTDIEYPSYYLEDYEEFELSSCYINDLDGVQFCIHARIIDVSNNLISDLSYLAELPNLEELNLSDNNIGYIDSLTFIKKLKSVDLSNNEIDDLSPLFNLVQLEYLNIEGNKVNKTQIDKLIALGVTVDF
jgi:hypothetical protein